MLYTVAVSFMRNWDVPLWKEYSGMTKIVRYNIWWLFEMASSVKIGDDGIARFEINNEDLGFEATEARQIKGNDQFVAA